MSYNALIFCLWIIAGLLLAFSVFEFYTPDTCPRCNRELDPDNHRGYYEGERRFCTFCRWEEEK